MCLYHIILWSKVPMMNCEGEIKALLNVVKSLRIFFFKKGQSSHVKWTSGHICSRKDKFICQIVINLADKKLSSHKITGLVRMRDILLFFFLLSDQECLQRLYGAVIADIDQLKNKVSRSSRYVLSYTNCFQCSYSYQGQHFVMHSDEGANAQNVSLETLYGDQFTFIQQLRL